MKLLSNFGTVQSSEKNDSKEAKFILKIESAIFSLTSYLDRRATSLNKMKPFIQLFFLFY